MIFATSTILSKSLIN